MKDKNHDSFFDDKTEEKGPEEKLMAMVDTIEKSPAVELKAGTMVKGNVHSIGKEYIFVDVGQKNEAVIKKVEFLDSEGDVTIKAGDTIDAFVISTDNDEIVLSKTLSGRKTRIKELIEASKEKIPVEGKVTGINKGGFNVTVMGRKAFCPFSHIELKYVDEPNSYLSKTFPFVITRVENRGRNIVLSRLPLLEKNLYARFDELEKYREGKKVLKGTISKITKFGLFVDLGGVEGLVHVSEVSWDRAENLKGEFKDGQIIECVILRIERKEPLKNSKISLSIRMVGENPWDNISKKLVVGSVVMGTITRLANFGAFVHLLPGIEGLIHISEMSWTKRVHHPSDIVSEGDNVKVTIIAVDGAKRSVSCSLKDIADNPWNSVAEKYPEGLKVSGIVVSETKYGFFVDLDESISGLLVRNKIAKEKKEDLKKGQKIEVTIEEIDIVNCRITLSYGIESSAGKYMKAAKQGDAGKKQKVLKKPPSEFGELLKAAFEKKK